MIIYLEGPDGSGKTTLGDHIQDSLSGTGITTVFGPSLNIPTHPKHPNRVNEKQLFKSLKTMAESKTALFIIDRGPISDIVYRVFDDYQPVTTLSKVIDFFKKYNKKILTIYCCSDDAEKNMLARGDENPIALKRHKEITKVYDIVMEQLFRELKFNYCKYNYSKKVSINETISLANYFVYMNR